MCSMCWSQLRRRRKVESFIFGAPRLRWHGQRVHRTLSLRQGSRAQFTPQTRGFAIPLSIAMSYRLRSGAASRCPSDLRAPLIAPPIAGLLQNGRRRRVPCSARARALARWYGVAPLVGGMVGISVGCGAGWRASSARAWARRFGAKTVPAVLGWAVFTGVGGLACGSHPRPHGVAVFGDLLRGQGLFAGAQQGGGGAAVPRADRGASGLGGVCVGDFRLPATGVHRAVGVCASQARSRDRMNWVGEMMWAGAIRTPGGWENTLRRWSMAWTMSRPPQPARQ
jgi:hypothetical protein